MSLRSAAGRVGKTEKVSISIERSDLSTLRKRARRLHGGNLSAAVAEGIRRIREEEGREALVTWLGKAGQASEEQREAVRAEWKTNAARNHSKRRRAT